MPRVAANAAAKEILVKTRQTHARTTLRNVRYLRGLGLVAWALGVTLGLAPARGLTLVATNAGLLDTSHPQVATLGGDTAHLLRVVTPGDRLTTALDLDVLLADGAPLTMTWRRDAGDAATIELAASLVIDSTPCHLAVQVRPVYDAVVALGAIGEVSTNSLVVVQQPALAVLRFAAGVGPLSDLALGAVDSTITYGPVNPWLIDVSGMAAGERFELIVRAGPPGDFDDDDDVDLADYPALHACLDAADVGTDCAAYFDLNGDQRIDLRDFAIFQAALTGDGVPAACGV
jgi:hypothetical protein